MLENGIAKTETSQCQLDLLRSQQSVMSKAPEFVLRRDGSKFPKTTDGSPSKTAFRSHRVGLVIKLAGSQ